MALLSIAILISDECRKVVVAKVSLFVLKATEAACTN